MIEIGSESLIKQEPILNDRVILLDSEDIGSSNMPRSKSTYLSVLKGLLSGTFFNVLTYFRMNTSIIIRLDREII